MIEEGKTSMYSESGGSTGKCSATQQHSKLVDGQLFTLRRLKMNTSKRILYAFAFTIWVLCACAQNSFAQETQVTCHAPRIVLSGGGDGSVPRVTVFCSGGVSAGNGENGIVYYAYPYSSNPYFAQSIVDVVGTYVREFGSNASITIFSNFSVSGVSIGCGFANCRLLDQVFGL
jgi:hypothetical protein